MSGLDDWGRTQPPAAVEALFDALPRTDGCDFLEDAETLWHWLGLALGKKGVPWGNGANAARVIARHERYANKFYYDEVRDTIYHTLNGAAEPLTDAWLIREVEWVQRHLNVHHWPKTPIIDAVCAISTYSHLCVNPLHDDIESVQWDKTVRLETWLQNCYGASDTPYTRAVGKNWLIGAVARAYAPGCQMDNMMVLEGPQGIGKSRSLKVLAGDFYVSMKGDITNKDFVLAAHRGWIADIDELGSFRKAEFDHIKGVLSTPVDTLRKPYGHIPAELKRRFVFAGTTNNAQYLRDDTGNRRFWPVACDLLDVNLKWLEANRSQLLAEAKVCFDAGEKWWEVPASAAAVQDERMEVDPWISVLGGLLEQKSGKHIINGGLGKYYFIATEELLYALGIAIADMNVINRKRVVACMKRAAPGWEAHPYDDPNQPITLTTGTTTVYVRGFRCLVAGQLPPPNVTDIKVKF